MLNNMCKINSDVATVSTLTADQTLAFNQICKFLTNKDEHVFVLLGSAGVGKSYLTKYIVSYIQNNFNKIVLGIAPTHKAKRVLTAFLNNDRLIDVPTMTVASFLGKMRNHSYIGTKNYSKGNANKLVNYDVLILDEVSMCQDQDYKQINDYIFKHKKKFICIGDPCQIPCPSQGLIKVEHGIIKADSIAFQNDNKFVLNHIVRQAENSSIIKLSTYLRNNLLVRNQMDMILQELNLNEFLIEKKKLYDNFVADFERSKSTKIIAYTNARVYEHNKNVRLTLNYEDKYVVGEIMIGVNNIGYPHLIIENGCEYTITKIQSTNRGKAGPYNNLEGYQVTLKSDTTVSVFFVIPTHPKNLQFMEDIIKRAEKVNANGSNIDDFKQYCQLKNTTIFTDSIYYYCGKVMTEAVIKEEHPLLFTKCTEVIDTDNRIIRDNQLCKNIEELYPGIIDDRLMDTKTYADGEMLIDRWCVIEKDIDYGYSITAHKCQGSTYQNAYVDDDDFDKIKDTFNYKYHEMEFRTKEFNQLKYVACTRAAKKLNIVI